MKRTNWKREHHFVQNQYDDALIALTEVRNELFLCQSELIEYKKAAQIRVDRVHAEYGASIAHLRSEFDRALMVEKESVRINFNEIGRLNSTVEQLSRRIQELERENRNADRERRDADARTATVTADNQTMRRLILSAMRGDF